MLGGLKMDGGCETEMHITMSPKPFIADISHELMVHALSTKSKKKSVERHNRKISAYQRHHKTKEQDAESFFSNTCVEEFRSTKELGKKFQETKAKKNKKEKLDKNKKNDVLPVTTINDENRTSVYQRTNSSGALGPHAVNGNISPPSAINNKPADLFLGNSTPNSHNFPDGAQTLATDNTFNTLYGVDGNFPDFLEAGSLDDLLSTGNDLAADPGDISSILDHLQETLPDSFREHVRAFEAQSPQVPYENIIKNENFASPNDMNGFLSPESRGSNSTPNSVYASPRNGMAASVMNGPIAIQRVTPDNVRPSMDQKRYLPSQADNKPLPSFPVRYSLPTAQASDRTYNSHQKPISPFSSVHDSSARLDPQKPSGPVMNVPHGNGSFPMLQQQQQVQHAMQQQSSMEMSYSNPHAFGRPVGQQMQSAMPFDNMHMQAQRHGPMRPNNPASAVGGARYYSADVPGQPQFQQAPISQNSITPVTYTNHMGDAGIVYSQNPAGASYGNSIQPGYGQMVQNRLPSVQYAATPSIRAPQYRTAMQPQSSGQAVGSRIYMNPTGNGSGGPYANHMQNPSVYPANIEQQPSMRQHMTGYRPPTYGQQQPMKTGLVQQPQQQHYAPSTNLNVPQQQQPPQHMQQSTGFFQMQSNGGFAPDQQGNFVHSHGDPYGAPGSWTSSM